MSNNGRQFYGTPEGLGIAPWPDQVADREGRQEVPEAVNDADWEAEQMAKRAVDILRRLPWLPLRGWQDPDQYARYELEIRRAEVLLSAANTLIRLQRK